MVIILILLVLSFCVSILETSINSINLATLNIIYKLNPKYSSKKKQINRILSNYSAILSIIIIVNSLCGIISSALVTDLCFRFHVISSINVLSIAIISFFFIFIGEIIPKNLGRVYPEKVIVFLSSFVIVLLIIFKPITILTDIVFKRFKYSNSVTKQHLIEWIRLSELDGQISNTQRTMIESAIVLNQKKINDSMILKKNIIFLSISNSFAKNMEIVNNYRYSRYIILDQDKNPIGKILTKDILKEYISDTDLKKSQKNYDYSKITRKILTLDINLTLGKALDLFRKEREHIAVIVDGNKNFLGVLFLENIIEEIIGEIYDEEETYSIIEFGNKLFHVSITGNIKEIFKINFPKIPLPKTSKETFVEWLVENNNNKPLKNYQTFRYDNLNIIFIKPNAKLNPYLEIHYAANDTGNNTIISNY